MKRQIAVLMAAMMSASLIMGCGNKAETPKPAETQAQTEAMTEAETEPQEIILDGPGEMAPLADGIYTAEFDTDSGMFHVNEACEGKGTLTVQDGEMSIHISLVSKKIQNLYVGLAEDAQKEGAVWLEPTTDEVTYSDGYTEEVYGFDVPVPYLDAEFDLALVGEKGTWYDHKVSVSDPVPADEAAEEAEGETKEILLAEGSFFVDVTLEGGSGRATVTSPCEIRNTDEGMFAVIEWSSPNYDFMIVDGEEYLPVNEDGNSVFEIPVADLSAPLEVQADTVAMSTPHLIDYTLVFEE